LEALVQTRKKAEKNLEDTRAELEDSTYRKHLGRYFLGRASLTISDISVEGGEESGDGTNDGKTDNSKKRNIEEKWDLSFSPDAETMTNYFPDGPEAWRKTIQGTYLKQLQVLLI
jgi:hypothetical protein